MTLSHTVAQLAAEIQADRVDRGEPEEGAIASAAEVRRFLRQFKG